MVKTDFRLPVFTTFYLFWEYLVLLVNIVLYKVHKTSGRIVVYAKDVQRLTGKSAKSSRDLYNKIRQFKGKAKHQLVSIEDFAEFTGISINLIIQHLTD